MAGRRCIEETVSDRPGSDTGGTVRTAERSCTRPSCACGELRGLLVGERGERHQHCAEHLKLGAACQPPWPAVDVSNGIGRRRSPADTATLRPVNPQARTRPGASGQLSAVCQQLT